MQLPPRGRSVSHSLCDLLHLVISQSTTITKWATYQFGIKVQYWCMLLEYKKKAVHRIENAVVQAYKERHTCLKV